MLHYCKKNPLVVLAFVSAVISALMFFLGRAYEKGCTDTTVKQVSQATSELYIDIKEIKKDVSEQRVDIAVLKENVGEMKSGIADIKAWIKPSTHAENNNGLQDSKTR